MAFDLVQYFSEQIKIQKPEKKNKKIIINGYNQT